MKTKKYPSYLVAGRKKAIIKRTKKFFPISVNRFLSIINSDDK